MINLVQDDDLEEFEITIEGVGGDGSTNECTQAQLQVNLTYTATNATQLEVGRSVGVVLRVGGACWVNWVGWDM